MLKRTELRALAFVLGAATVVACSETATAPDAQTSASDVLFAKGSKGKPKPDDSSGGATTLGDFTGSIALADITVDGVITTVSTLVNRVDKVSITLNNRLDVSTWSGNSKQEERQGFAHKLCTDMKNLVILDIDDRKAYLLAASLPPNGEVTGILCSKARMHTRNEDIEFDRLAIHDIAHAGGKIVPRELDSNGAWDWRIIFDTSSDGVGGDDVIGEGLCVERVDANTWKFFNGCTLPGRKLDAQGNVVDVVVDTDVQLWRYNAGPPRMVAEFEMPFSFTVTSG